MSVNFVEDIRDPNRANLNDGDDLSSVLRLTLKFAHKIYNIIENL